uniref:Ion_trans_2 domain-containing protein n=1 Tax=Panagrellus redivivus TaxID=6233 RepID=A0A7E4VDA3_PANRE
MDEIRRLDAEDKLDLEVFDLPIPVAVVIVVVYICICAQTFRYVEKDWDYFTAFYYFFICLSTIGLGDISPSKPKFVLVLFIQIMVGLSLCSMCINVIQAKMKRTYEAGKMQFDNLSSIGGSEHRLHWDSGTNGPPMKPRRRGSSLGVFRTCGSSYSLNREAIQERLARKDKHNKSTQTVLSFPSPTRNNLVSRSVNNGRMKRLPRTLSIDDVMKLVDTEEGDILLLTELAREESMASGLSTTTNTEDVSDTSQIVISKSFETNFNPALLVNHKSNTLPTIITPESKLSTTSAPVGTVAMAESPPPAEIGIAVPSGRLIRPSTISLQELEAQEEMEDRLALGNVLENAGVHFRSRLSLIPEHHSIIDEDGEPSVESKPPSPTDLRSPPLSSTNQNDGRGSRASSASGHSASIGSRIASILGRRRSSASVSSR